MKTVRLDEVPNEGYFKMGTISFKKIGNLIKADNTELYLCKVRSQEVYVYVSKTTQVLLLEA